MNHYETYQEGHYRNEMQFKTLKYKQSKHSSF